MVSNFLLFVCHLFLDWDNICLFQFIWKTFIYYTIIKKNISGDNTDQNRGRYPILGA